MAFLAQPIALPYLYVGYCWRKAIGRPVAPWFPLLEGPLLEGSSVNLQTVSDDIILANVGFIS